MEGLIAIWMLPVWTIGVPLLWALFDLFRLPHTSVRRQAGAPHNVNVRSYLPVPTPMPVTR